MNIQTRNSPVMFVLAILAIVALSSSACSFSRARGGTISPVVDITITQDEFDQSPPTITIHSNGPYDRLLDRITHVEIHDGFIRYLGTRVQADGFEVDGSFDLSLGAENDMLKARIVAVDIPGIDLDDPCIVEANHEMEDELTRLVADPHSEVLFKEVTAREGELRMKIQVNINY